ncbi:MULTISPECIES: hypothetical protein [Colwellia]|uniref:Uncharacterized protein n=1 Tax=Colwellia marinimaniae TaxID=1513592 RepID=A0ABQ0N0C3_9GAMM|nr:MULTISPECIES: hypothetical protein [Colwellia]GAW98004.1 hypothetical protein MTCD1_03662 [Colwellia marinimaniae]
MKTVSIILLFFTFHFSAMAEKGFVVNILPDKLTLPIDCEAQINLQRLRSAPEKFSIGYS